MTWTSQFDFGVACLRMSARAAAFLAVLFVIAAQIEPADATAPTVLRTSGYQSPVHGGPDDLLFIAGEGFHSTDCVVYEASDSPWPGGRHPAEVPRRSGPTSGTARIIRLG